MSLQLILHSTRLRMIVLYFLVISALSVAAVILDKIAAMRRAMRIPEAVLLLLAFMGGDVSMFMTMLIVRHKTQKPKFMIGIPVIFILHIALFLFLVWRFVESRG